MSKTNISNIKSNINILENNNYDIKYIIHLADIHIRNDRQQEYEAVFETLYADLIERNLNKTNSVCCIIGDVFHSTQINAIAIQTCKNFFYKLSEITSIIVTYGNHDVKQNNSSLNNLAAIIKTNFTSLNKIYYIEQNQTYLFNNILFGLTNTYSKEVYSIKSTPSKYKSLTKVALYHGTITGAKTQSNYTLNEPGLFSAGDFDSYNITLLGDIHKYQYMNKKKTIAYCGSLIQQNKGESLEKGYLLWNIKKNSSKFIPIYNQKGILKIKINPDGSFIIPPNLPKQLVVDISSESPNRTDIESVYEELIRLDIDILERNEYLNLNQPIMTVPDLLTASDLLTEPTEPTVSNPNSPNSPLNPNPTSNFLSRLSNRTEISTLIQSQILKINLLDQTAQTKLNEKISSLLNDITFKDTHIKNIKLISLEFSDVMKYGPNNRIDFSKLDNIYGLCCANSSGKSTIIDTILFAIYGVSTRGIPGDMINYQCKNMKTLIRLQVNGISYDIARKVMRNSKGLETRQTKGEISIKENGLEIGLDIKKSLQIIEDKISPYDDFIKNCIITQHSKVNFINFSPKEKVEYLCKISRIDIINNLSQLCSANLRNLKSELTKKRKNLIQYESYSSDENLIQNKINLKLTESTSLRNTLSEEYNLNQHKIQTYQTQIKINENKIASASTTASTSTTTSTTASDELAQIKLEDINLEELSVRLSKFSAEKDLLYELINKTDYNLLREEFDSNKSFDIKQKEKEIRLLSNKIFNDPSFNPNKYIYDDIIREISETDAILETLSAERTSINDSKSSLTKLSVKKIPKINLKLKDSYENVLKINENLTQENTTISSELSSLNIDFEKVQTHEYDPKCKYCRKNNISKQQIYLKELILTKNNLYENNRLIIEKNNLYIQSKLNAYNKIKSNEIIIENINKANSELAVKSNQLDMIQNKIAIHTIKNDSNKMILTKLEQYSSNKVIFEQISVLESELELIHNSKCTAYEEYLSANAKFGTISNEIDSIKKILTHAESIKVAQSIETDKASLRTISELNANILSKIDALDKFIHTYKTDLLTFNSSYKDIISIKDDLNTYQLIDTVVCNQEFTNKILEQNVLPQLETELNKLLKKFSDYTINIFFIKDSIFIYKNNGSNLVMNGGYESNLINIIFRIVFTKLTGTVRTDFIIIDEFLDSSDESNKENILKVINYMQNIYKWAIVISHDVNIRENFLSNIIIKTVDSKQHIMI